MVDVQISSAIGLATSRLERVEREIVDSTTKLASGSSVPNASANAANLAISSRLAFDIASQNVINTNISSGVSAAQIADATYAQTIELATRAKVLALNATSGNLGAEERALLDKEYQKILEEIDRIARDAEFNGIKLGETGIVPIVAATNFADGTLPGGSFIPTPGTPGATPGTTNTAVINNGVLELINKPDDVSLDPPNSQGVYVNDKAFILEAGLTADFRIQVGFPPGTSTENLGGGFSFFLYDGDQVDFSGATNPLPLGGVNASRLLYYQNDNVTPAPGGFLAIGFESNGGFGNGGPGDEVTVVGPDPLPGGQIDNVPLTAPDFPNGLDGPGADPLMSQENTFDISLSISEDLRQTVSLTDVTTGAGATVVDDEDISFLDVPDTLKFGFGGTIGGLSNRFAVESFDVRANTNVEERMNEAALLIKASTSSNASIRQLSLPIFDATTAGLTIDETNIRSVEAAEFALDRLNFGLDQAVGARAVMGATLSRFEQVQDFLSTKIENLQASRSGLADLNVAREVTRRTALDLQMISGVEVIRDGQAIQALNALLFTASEQVSTNGVGGGVVA